MKYIITINQKSLMEVCPQIKLKEAAVLDYLILFCSSVHDRIEEKRITVKGERYTWIDYGHIINDLPLLRIKSRSCIFEIVEKLAEMGLISLYLDKKAGNKKYARITKKGESVSWNYEEDLFGKTKSLFGKTNTPFSEKQTYNNTIKDNSTKNHCAKNSRCSEAEPDNRFSASTLNMTPSQEEPKSRKKKAYITDAKDVEVLTLYKNRIYKSVTNRTKSMVEGLNRARRMFKEVFGDDAHNKLLEAINLLPEYGTYQWLLEKNPTANTPKRVFSAGFIENHLIPLVTEKYDKRDAHLATRPQTEEEQREIQKANRERVRKFMERNAGRKTS